MTLNIYMAFVLTATIILVIPGPTIILVISQAVAHGRKSVAPLVKIWSQWLNMPDFVTRLWPLRR